MSTNRIFTEMRIGQYFSMSYLIKFGYFDFKFNLKQYEEDYILSNIVFKKVFNTHDLEEKYTKIKKEISFNSKKDTAPIELSIYKNEDERRIFKLPNMYSYISLCRHLIEHREKYMDILLSSSKSLSNEFYNTSYLSGKIKRENNRIGKRKIFKTDIQNFYPSIYTHSIPWILVGKIEAKGTKYQKEKYYNNLDTLIQRCQMGETHGIPTGSFVSRLISEIYMCKLDEKLDKYEYVRYVDDFELPYNDENEKSAFYKDLNKELISLNLKVKVEKNKIELFPFEDGNNSAFFFDYFITNCERNIKSQRKRIYNFIEESVLREREGYKGSLILMFKALKESVSKGDIKQDALTTAILNKLFNFVLMKPILSVNYLEFVDVLDNRKKENELKFGIKQIKKQIINNISRYIELNYNQELFSLLSIFYYLDIQTIFSKEQLFDILCEMDDLSSILSFEMLLNDEDNINEILFEKLEDKLKNSKCWEDEYWLFKYHIFNRINADKRTKISREYKSYFFNKYNEKGLDKSNFFNRKNFNKIDSPINIAVQHANSEPDISKFYKKLLKNKICFVERK